MNTLALNATPYPSSPIGANIAAIVERLLRADTPSTGTSTNSADAEAKLGSILKLLLNPKNGAALMDINLDQLVGNLSLQNLIKQLPAELFSKPQVFEALVMQNTLLSSVAAPETAPTLPQLILPKAPAQASYAAPVAAALYRLTLSYQNRLVQVLSPQPFPRGTQLQLQSRADGELILLARNGEAATPATAQSTMANAGNAAVSRSATPLVSSPTVATASDSPKVTQQAVTPEKATPAPIQTLQQSLRELLPKQLPLHTLLPQLQKLLTPNTTQTPLPAALVKLITQLLQSLPRPEQLQNPLELRQIIENSGSFFEERLTRAQVQTTPGDTPDTLATLLGSDIKAQIKTLLAVVQRIAPDTAKAAASMAHTQAPIGDDDFVYSHKPTVPNTAASAAPEKPFASTVDTLTQLSKLLQSGLARIELNQVESASARHTSNDMQAPVPTWVVEVPVRTPYGADQFQLRIEQQQKKYSGRARQQWQVHIALDLHAAGKLAATLTIVEKSVAATLWAEQEKTHRAVHAELDYLRAGLESIGVKVTEMQCRHGVPPARSAMLSQRLVDVHT